MHWKFQANTDFFCFNCSTATIQEIFFERWSNEIQKKKAAKKIIFSVDILVISAKDAITPSTQQKICF